MTAAKIVITTTSFGEHDNSFMDKFRKGGFDVVLNPYKRTVKSDELVGLAKDAVGIIAGTESITGEALAKLPKLKVISRCGAGTDNVDIEAVRRLGIKLFNTPDAPTVAVAELTVGMMLALLRNISQADRDVRNGIWKKRMGGLLAHKKIGIIGFGRIGRKVAQLLSGFSCEIGYNDPLAREDTAPFKNFSKEDLLKWADIISIHVNSGEAILKEKDLRAMKKGALLINTSRGGAIDETALYDLLKEGHIGGAAIDVFRKEPYEGKLSQLENVILTPHVGSYAREARVNMEREAVENLLKGLEERQAQK